jgi:DNA-binding response OmpR family regulator
MFARRECMKLLVVDDSERFRNLLSYMLNIRGFMVDQARNGKLALDKIRKSKPDIIILDAMMPEMDGFELCRILKKDKDTRDIYIIFCTALGKREIDDKDITFDDYIEKPFPVEKLCRKIDKLIKKKEKAGPKS